MLLRLTKAEPILPAIENVKMRQLVGIDWCTNPKRSWFAATAEAKADPDEALALEALKTFREDFRENKTARERMIFEKFVTEFVTEFDAYTAPIDATGIASSSPRLC